MLDEVLVARRRADLPPTPPALRAVEGHRVPLDVALVGDRDHHVLFDDQILDRDRRGLGDELGTPRIGIFGPELPQLLRDDLPDLPLIGEDCPVALDRLLGLRVLFHDLVALEARQTLQPHL